MSIIYDALKKVEQTRQEEPQDKLRAGTEKPRPRLRIYLTYAVALFLGVWMMDRTFVFFSKPAAKQASQEAIYNYAPVSPAVTKAAAAIAPAKVTFNLNGIFFSEDEGFALINNQIVKVGDDVDGAKVLQISVNEVELDSQGSLIKLSSGS